MSKKLTGKVAIVTGASKGTGPVPYPLKLNKLLA